MPLLGVSIFSLSELKQRSTLGGLPLGYGAVFFFFFLARAETTWLKSIYSCGTFFFFFPFLFVVSLDKLSGKWFRPVITGGVAFKVMLHELYAPLHHL